MVAVKTPEGIKSELKKYGSGEEWDVSKECAKLCKRAFAYIKKLESRLDQAEQKMDAALKTIGDVCSFCNGKAFEVCGGYPPDCERCMLKGYCPENTKEVGT